MFGIHEAFHNGTPLMFPYYGGKGRIVRWYPEPIYRTVIEPFAGAANYTRYHKHRIERAILIDRSPVVIAAWKYLMLASRAEIERLPRLKPGQRIPSSLSLGERAVLSFFYNQGSESLRNFAGTFTSNHGKYFPPSRLWDDRAACGLWRVIEGDYRMAPDIEATWFIDPPYQGIRGSRYHDPWNLGLDYEQLGRWVHTRKGQVIVCEGERATWLRGFKPLVAQLGQRSHGARRSIAKHQEMVWIRRQS